MSWNTFTPCLEILPFAQQALWPHLREVTRLGFVLYGGTAIALRLGHRQSVDFDFFTERPFDHANLVMQRLEAKDYLDIHGMIRAGLRLEDGLAGARAMFGRAFQPAQALKALTWFQGGNLHELPAKVRHDLIAAAAKVQDLAAVPEVMRDLGGGRQ
jgi:hypothetical protein